MTYFISKCDDMGIPLDKPVKCSICDFISQTENGHSRHMAIHRRHETHSYHDDRLFKSGRYT